MMQGYKAKFLAVGAILLPLFITPGYVYQQMMNHEPAWTSPGHALGACVLFGIEVLILPVAWVTLSIFHRDLCPYQIK